MRNACGIEMPLDGDAAGRRWEGHGRQKPDREKKDEGSEEAENEKRRFAAAKKGCHGRFLSGT
jgi:hypothetical protein